MLGSLMVTVLRSERVTQLQMQIWDTSRAHFNGTAQLEIYVELPEEEQDGERDGWS